MSVDNDCPRAPGSGATILVVEDDAALSEIIRLALEREGYTVLGAPDGERGVHCYRMARPDLVLLDVTLPRMSGLDVCRLIRAESGVPLVMVTGRASEADKVSGLELGADDYITKPFSIAELISRVRAQLRRSRMAVVSSRVEDDVLVGGPVELDLGRHEVRVRGRHVALTPKEFRLLASFLSGRGRLRTREYLITEVWGSEYFGDTKTLDVHVKRLRQKIERDPQNPEHLVTVRGLGYRFLDQPVRDDSPHGGLRLTLLEAQASTPL